MNSMLKDGLDGFSGYGIFFFGGGGGEEGGINGIQEGDIGICGVAVLMLFLMRSCGE